MADRVQGLSAGGIGVMLLLAHRIGLIRDIDANLHLLKVHLPYHESDHVLNIAFNLLAGGQRIEHLELRRNDEVYLNALGAERIPDPTTAGDFCRRFAESDVTTLMDTFNHTRLRVWAKQPPEFFEEAILDADGTIVPSGSECKRGMDFTYDGQYGFHPLLISLANTGEPLYLFNRSGNRPSQDWLTSTWTGRSRFAARPASARSCCEATPNSPRPGTWIAGTTRATSVSSSETRPDSLEARADDLPAEAYSPLKRPHATRSRPIPARSPSGSNRIVRDRGYETFTCPRRWSRSSNTGRRPVRRLIG